MDMLKSVWILVHSILWPSMSYESTETTESIHSNTSLHFQVIGAGLSRTGTFSTRIALTSLLGGKCYHGYVASLDGEPDFWQRAATGVLSGKSFTPSTPLPTPSNSYSKFPPPISSVSPPTQSKFHSILSFSLFLSLSLSSLSSLSSL